MPLIPLTEIADAVRSDTFGDDWIDNQGSFGSCNGWAGAGVVGVGVGVVVGVGVGVTVTAEAGRDRLRID